MSAMLIMMEAVTASPNPMNDVTIPYFGVPINIIVASCAGSLAGFAFAKEMDSRVKIFQIFFACVVLGCASTALLQAYLKFKYKADPQYMAAIAMIVSCLARWLWPAIIERLGPWLDKIPFLRKNDPPKGE
jgi:hypothetical protein